MRDEEYEPGPVRALLEASVTIGLLSAAVLLVPLGSQGFPYVSAGACLSVLGYVGYNVVRHKSACLRWGLTPSDGDEGWVSGCFFLGVLFLASLLPTLLIHAFVEVPRIAHPAVYFVWCAVQDFVFFALILRNLEDLTHPFLALVVTAVLFGFSHYPFFGFMILTGFVGAVWGYLYVMKRSLLLIIACHWVMGVVVLI